ncbi:hypothetical protein R3P38DRAFT_501161 [Favolaschia claudopus]|uniref:Uncharacterized protein n=1 Tax=Favolaschia claudopus TaxID=2862362 RepID=A0AAV9ZE62_9AGAR
MITVKSFALWTFDAFCFRLRRSKRLSRLRFKVWLESNIQICFPAPNTVIPFSALICFPAPNTVIPFSALSFRPFLVSHPPFVRLQLDADTSLVRLLQSFQAFRRLSGIDEDSGLNERRTCRRWRPAACAAHEQEDGSGFVFSLSRGHRFAYSCPFVPQFRFCLERLILALCFARPSVSAAGCCSSVVPPHLCAVNAYTSDHGALCMHDAFRYRHAVFEDSTQRLCIISLGSSCNGRYSLRCRARRNTLVAHSDISYHGLRYLRHLSRIMIPLASRSACSPTCMPTFLNAQASAVLHVLTWS